MENTITSLVNIKGACKVDIISLIEQLLQLDLLKYSIVQQHFSPPHSKYFFYKMRMSWLRYLVLTFKNIMLNRTSHPFATIYGQLALVQNGKKKIFQLRPGETSFNDNASFVNQDVYSHYSSDIENILLQFAFIKTPSSIVSF